ncbi:MAG: CfrBI family restriction endonuclease [Acidobacteriota bacterium]|nr:CfrBI family restriction endonuclease [Acidobacteriota bacterium]
MRNRNSPSINDLFPEGGRILLTGSGREFVERIGTQAIKHAILSVMMGENIRTQTEPLSRRRIAITSGAVVTLFARGLLEVGDFTDKVSGMAVEQIATAKRNDKASVWIAQWLLGLTGKSVQNVLRSDPEAIGRYVADFEAAIEEVAEKCRDEFGDLRMTLGFYENAKKKRVELNWKDIARLTTALGSQTLAIRGSDKSMYGKLFERLILGTFLSTLGFERVNPLNNRRTSGVFWLSDSSDLRESDATLLVKPGKVARFDIGFIGIGNSEISKDKLSRYAREFEMGGGKRPSVTFIVVDRLPKSGKTQRAAEQIGAEIVQMSMQFWVRELAQKLGERLGVKHELQKMDDDAIGIYLERKLSFTPVEDFLSGVSVEELEEASEGSESVNDEQ